MGSTREDEDFTSNILDEVFNEVESLENSKEEATAKQTGFLEDVVQAETDRILNNKKSPLASKIQTDTSQSNLQKVLEQVESLIHEGFTDSSDDEDNKYFEEEKYNKCGKDLRKLIKNKTASSSERTLTEVSNTPKEDKWESNRQAREKLQIHLQKLKGGGINNEKLESITTAQVKNGNNNLVDPILFMRIVNPLVSSTSLKEKMIGRVAISTSKIKKFLGSFSSPNVDWVTGGAIVGKTCRTSQKGNQYCLWSISDLNGDIKTVSVYLFGSAYNEFWKLSVGTVVGLLNPGIMENKDRSEATLRVDNQHKILVMGMSKDYGICKSKKKNGENCTSVVNISKCEFCTYHLRNEYVKACRRSDLQPPKPGRDNLQKKVLGKNQVFAGGKLFTGVTGKKSWKSSEKDKQRLKTLCQNTQTLSQSHINKDRNILSRLCESPMQTLTSPATPNLSKPFASLTPQSPLNQTPITSPRNHSQPITPVSSQQSHIDLNFTVTRQDRSAAKVNALNFVRTHGPIKKINDSEKKKKTPEQIASLKRKLDTDDGDKSVKTQSTVEADAKKQKLERVGITEKFLELMNAGVKNKDHLKAAENEQQEKYFNKLEIREKMEDKMASTFKIECKAVRCLKCNYKSFSASELCKKEKHPLKIVNAVKRFWKCGNCSNRTVCLELVPVHACKNCGSGKWERASMMAEKKGPNLNVEPLSLRGMEEKFIGATVKNASLSLLVPEEAS